MSNRRRACARLLLAGVALLPLTLAAPSLAHERAIPELVAPAAGTVVTGDAVEVVVRASATGTPAEFQLFLDDVSVDASGTLGGVFTTLRVDAGQELRMFVTLDEPGSHTLRLVPAPHEKAEPTIVRQFTAEGDSESSATASPTASASATPIDPAPKSAEDKPIGRGMIIVLVLALGLLAAGAGAVAYSRTTD